LGVMYNSQSDHPIHSELLNRWFEPIILSVVVLLIAEVN
jgi:hypothetical protein